MLVVVVCGMLNRLVELKCGIIVIMNMLRVMVVIVVMMNISFSVLLVLRMWMLMNMM